jgi:hypothetical protein
MLSSDLDHFNKDGDVQRGLKAVVGGMCNAETTSDSEWAALDEAYRKLSARFGLSEDDWADVVDWALTKDGMNDTGVGRSDAKKVWSKYDPVDQYAGIEHNFVQAGNKYGHVEPAYFVDALGSNLTETGRLGWISWCMGQSNDDRAVIWAMCQGDIDAFDGKKVAAELRTAKDRSGYDRMSIRLVLDRVTGQLAKHAADVKKLIASDPIYGQMFDIAKKERAGWKPNPELLALDVAMEDAMVSQSRRASEGCAETTLKALLSSVSKIPAKTFTLHRKADEEAMIFFGKMTDVIASGLLSQPDSFLAANAYAMCQDMTGSKSHDAPLITSLVRNAGGEWAGFRGPRTAAQTRIFQANLQPDARDARIDFPQIERDWFGDRDGGGWRGSYGTVTKVSSKGGKIRIEFQKKKHQEYVSLNCKKTGRIQAIRANGDVVYEETCSDSKLITSMEGPDPVDVSAEQGKGVKAGMFVNVVEGYVLTAWPAKSDIPVVILGQPVK